MGSPTAPQVVLAFTRSFYGKLIGRMVTICRGSYVFGADVMRCIVGMGGAAVMGKEMTQKATKNTAKERRKTRVHLFCLSWRCFAAFIFPMLLAKRLSCSCFKAGFLSVKDASS